MLFEFGLIWVLNQPSLFERGIIRIFHCCTLGLFIIQLLHAFTDSPMLHVRVVYYSSIITRIYRLPLLHSLHVHYSTITRIHHYYCTLGLFINPQLHAYITVANCGLSFNYYTRIYTTVAY